jgi:hypothetical protein
MMGQFAVDLTNGVHKKYNEGCFVSFCLIGGKRIIFVAFTVVNIYV